MEAQERGMDVHELRMLKKAQRDEEEEEDDVRIRLLDGEDLLELMEERARVAVKVGQLKCSA